MTELGGNETLAFRPAADVPPPTPPRRSSRSMPSLEADIRELDIMEPDRELRTAVRISATLERRLSDASGFHRWRAWPFTATSLLQAGIGTIEEQVRTGRMPSRIGSISQRDVTLGQCAEQGCM